MGYEPMIRLQTSKRGDIVQIIVEDNGPGIPVAIMDKIFQPFFTTKPSGSGTGLGLSLSYDIITKIHGGKLSVESEEGQYTRFIVELPVGQA
jgi:signal transduction histidine kinase